MSRIAPLCALALLACAQPAPKAAGDAAVLDPYFDDVRVLVKESFPVQFGLALRAPMPTPGWTLTVDEVARPDAANRVRVRITAKGPDGPVIQVITPTEVHVSLGTLPPGRFLVDFDVRREGEDYRRVHALVLEAG